MPIFASLRNAVRWAGFDLGRSDGASAQAVVMIDPATGLAVSPTNVTLTGPITVSNEVEITNDVGSPIPVSGTVTANTGLAQPLTDTQLRASAVAVSGSAAVGVAPSLPPLSVSGVDAGGLKRHFRTDTTGNLGIYGAATRSTSTATIANAASVSGSIDLTSTALLGFIAPAAWTTAALNLEVSMDNTNWATVIYDSGNSPVGSWSAVVTGAAYAVDTVSMLPFRYVRLRSGTAASPVTQGAQRDFTVITRPLA